MEDLQIDDFITKSSAMLRHYEAFARGVTVSNEGKGAPNYNYVADKLRNLGVEFEGKFRDSSHIFPKLEVKVDSDGRERVTNKEGRDYYVHRIDGKRVYLSDAGSPQPRKYWVKETIVDGVPKFEMFTLNKNGTHGKKPLKYFIQYNYGVESDGREYIYNTRLMDEEENKRVNYTKYLLERADDGIYLRPWKKDVDENEFVYEVVGSIDNVSYKPRSYKVYKLRKNNGKLDPLKDYRVFDYKRDGHKAIYKIKQEEGGRRNTLHPLMQLFMGGILKSLKAQNGQEAIDVWARIFLNLIVKGADPDLSVISFYESLPDEEHVKAFETLLTHILDRQPVQFEYYSKNAGRERKVHIHPYMFKNYNKRWYLIGRELADDCDPLCRPLRYKADYSHDKQHPVSCLALDGIRGPIEVWYEDFVEWGVRPIDFFEGLIGVTPHKDGEQMAILRFSKQRYRYVESKPLTETQEEIKEGEEYFDAERPTIRLKVHFNRELTQQILSFGPDVEVIYPQSLRDEVAKLIRSMSDIYK